LPPFSAEATVAVVTAGAAAAVAGWLTRPRPARPPGPGIVAGWVALGLAVVGWQLASYLQSPRSEHPTLSSLTNAVLSTQGARAIAFVLWLGAMVFIARR
jgi:hypothetical protein